MTEIKVFRGQQLIDSELTVRIIEFDRQNMASTLQESGAVFPEENRLKGFRRDPTLIVAFQGEQIVGYVEYLRSCNDSRYSYVSSLQIAPPLRHSKLILQLLDQFIEVVRQESFIGFEANVQKANGPAVKLYRKLGFTLTDNPRNEASYVAKAGPELLSQSPILPLIEKWKAETNPRRKQY